MPDWKYLYHTLYTHLDKLLIFKKKKIKYYQKSYNIDYIYKHNYNTVITVAEWLDASFQT